MGSSSRQISGWRYQLGIHMGVCRGPVDELVEIRVGERTAWSKDIAGAITTSGTATIDAPDLFGGDEKEGGIQGTLTVLMGEATQEPPAILRTVMPGLVPGFRGKFTLFFDGQVAVNNPYPKTWTVRSRRTTTGWQDNAPWYPAKAAIWLGVGPGLAGIKAMNAAHIIYELYTNADWGRGLPAARLDIDSFAAAADQLFSEGFGLCLVWLRQESLGDFQQRVLDHIGAMCGPDPHTGKIRMRLIRDDYTPEELPLFTYGTGLLGVDQEEGPAAHETTNEIVVKWFDPVLGQERQTAPVQNLAAIQGTGARNTSVRDYPGLSTASLALRVAQRDLKASSPGLKRFKVRLDRRAYWIQPGDVFRIASPDRGIGNVVLRAGEVREGELTDGVITVTAVIDVFGLPATAMVSTQPSLHVPVDYTPAPAIHRQLLELPWFKLAGMLSASELAAVDPLTGYVAAAAVRPTGVASWDFSLLTRTASADYIDRGMGFWCPTATVVGAVPASAAPAAVTLSNTIDLETVRVGTAALWGVEIVRVDAVNAVARTATLARGCADTVPVQHDAGSRIWFFDEPVGIDPSPWLRGESVDVKLLTRTPSGRLSQASAPVNTISIASRHYRPYPPGRVQLNSVAYPDEISGLLTVTWQHRDRVLQADQLVDTTQASIGPESGTTYTLRIYGESNVLLKTVTGMTGTSYAFSDEMAVSGLGHYESQSTLFSADGETEPEGWVTDLHAHPGFWGGRWYDLSRPTVEWFTGDYFVAREHVLPGHSVTDSATINQMKFYYSVDAVSWVRINDSVAGKADYLNIGNRFINTGNLRYADAPDLSVWSNGDPPGLLFTSSNPRTTVYDAGADVVVVMGFTSSNVSGFWQIYGLMCISEDQGETYSTQMFGPAQPTGAVSTGMFSPLCSIEGTHYWAWNWQGIPVGLTPAPRAARLYATDYTDITQDTDPVLAMLTRIDSMAATATVRLLACCDEPLPVTTLKLLRSVAGGDFELVDVPWEVSGVLFHAGYFYGRKVIDDSWVRSTDITGSSWTDESVTPPDLGPETPFPEYGDEIPDFDPVVERTTDEAAGGTGSLRLLDPFLTDGGADADLDGVAALLHGETVIRAQLMADDVGDVPGIVLASTALHWAIMPRISLDVANGRVWAEFRDVSERLEVTGSFEYGEWYEIELTIDGPSSASLLVTGLPGGPLTATGTINYGGLGGVYASVVRLLGSGYYDDIEVIAQEWIGRLNNSLRIELESVRDGLVSHQKHNIGVLRSS